MQGKPESILNTESSVNWTLADYPDFNNPCSSMIINTFTSGALKECYVLSKHLQKIMDFFPHTPDHTDESVLRTSKLFATQIENLNLQVHLMEGIYSLMFRNPIEENLTWRESNFIAALEGEDLVGQENALPFWLLAFEKIKISQLNCFDALFKVSVITNNKCLKKFTGTMFIFEKKFYTDFQSLLTQFIRENELVIRIELSNWSTKLTSLQNNIIDY